MSRRPHSFKAYVRRRWRIVGFAAVLLCGALLVLALTDRGHDPQWTARGPVFAQVALAPDGGTVYTLTAHEGGVGLLEARRGDTGDLAWQSPLNASRALLEAGPGWVAVATDFPAAFLTVYGEDGSALLQVALEGNPRALTAAGTRVAIALQAPANPVLVFDDGEHATTHHFENVVTALDASGGHLAVGLANGAVILLDEDGARVLESNLPMRVRSLRLDAEARHVLAGGARPGGTGLGGVVALLEVDAETPLRWIHETYAQVAYVDLDARGRHAIAVEELAPAHRVHAFDAQEGRRPWTRHLTGEVAQADSGSHGGVALSPDGRIVAMSTLRGAVEVVDARTGATLWTHRSHGTTEIAFAAGAPDRFAANARLSPTGDYDALLGFHVEREPPLSQAPRVAALLTLLIMGGTFGGLFAGYWRLRRA